MLDHVAEENGVAVVVLDANGREASASNNNSMCGALYDSPEFAPRCAEFCGAAFRKTASGEDFNFECHAGLTCKAVPVSDKGQRFVAIIGRTFTTAENYRKATSRAISGDWRDFPANEFFENVLISSSAASLDRAAGEVSKFRVTEPDEVLELDRPVAVPPPSPEPEAAAVAEPIEAASAASEIYSASDAGEMRSLAGTLSKLGYVDACSAVLEFLRSSFGFESMVWLERENGHFAVVTATGAFRAAPIKIGIAADNARLAAATQHNRPLELRERVVDGSGRTGRVLNIFAAMVGGDIRAAVGIEENVDNDVSRRIVRICRVVGPQLEILRLRREISDREWLNRAVGRFNEGLKHIDGEDFWTHVTQISAELVQAERASLLLRHEQSESLFTKAAVGAKINLFAEPMIGERVSRLVLEDGQPVVIEDIQNVGLRPAPAEWKYKSASFLSYPILIGDRRIGVMNFTDKVGGDSFDARDLQLLHAIAPQIAVAIDRTVLKDKAGEFEQLSVTDALTGLLNRRYIEKRLVEEIQRSKRHRFPMSLMMLDVDEFKAYNDTFGHPAGDTALKIVASVLQDILRGADVAARYGGEEFAILLPQTTATEAAAIAERLRQRIEHTEFPKRKVTVSIGIASCTNEIDTPAHLVDAADQALYEAKNHGRNNVQVYDGLGKRLNENIH